jgi:hypothetical protein
MCIIPGSWKCEPENENELECVVEWEPVYGADGTLKYRQEGKHHPVLEIDVS